VEKRKALGFENDFNISYELMQQNSIISGEGKTFGLKARKLIDK